MKSRLLTVVILSLFVAAPTPLLADSPPALSVDQIDQQIAVLQKQRVEIKIAEARAAIETEKRKKAEAVAATKMADEGRAYLDSIDQVSKSQIDTSSPVAAGMITTTTVEKDGTKTVEVKTFSQKDLRDDDDGKSKFGGIEFGIGVAFSHDVGEHDRVKEASIVDGVVRVSKVENVRARMILESHYFFTPTFNYKPFSFLGLARNNSGDGEKNWGVGPFIALQPGSDEVIDAIGAGVMVGFKRPNSDSQSFNIGVGVLYDLNSQVLGDGILENEPLPGLETEVRYKERSQAGLLIMSSFTF